MTAGWAEAALGDLMLARAQNLDPAKFPDETFELFSIPAFDGGAPAVVEGSEIGSTKQLVQPGDVLLSRIVPHIRRAWTVESESRHRLLASGEWMVFRSGLADASYLRHFLVSDRFHVQFMATVAGVGGSLMRARPAFVARITVPLPPLDEQRRIAEVLDRVEAIRTARRGCLLLLGELRQAMLTGFLKSCRSESVRLSDVLATPFGNGISPATAGTHRGAVLTLTALREGSFDGTAFKPCVFAKPPGARQMVSRGTFLVSRGNGNLQLVGRGAVVTKEVPDVAFPDTMIGAKLDVDRVIPEFLEAIWSTPAIRNQIERSATTTSGIFKINQAKLGRVLISLPGREDQQRFCRTLRSIGAQRTRTLTHVAQLDALYASLEQREFSAAL